MTSHKIDRRLARKRRIRARITGTMQRPRMSVNVSLTRIAVQLIDDTAGRTVASAVSKDGKKLGKNMDAAQKLGTVIAEKAKAAGVTTVVFDRSGRKYHGRIKALADSARAGGLQF